MFNNITDPYLLLVPPPHLSSTRLSPHNLQTLNLSYNQIVSIEPLSRFEAPFLETLTLSIYWLMIDRNRIKAISQLVKIKSRPEEFGDMQILILFYIVIK